MAGSKYCDMYLSLTLSLVVLHDLILRITTKKELKLVVVWEGFPKQESDGLVGKCMGELGFLY
mgnify:CR=1 FL=1